MSRNLITLSTPNIKGYNHSNLGGVLKLTKGSLVHMMGDMNSAKLYVLRGNTIIGTAIVVAITSD